MGNSQHKFTGEGKVLGTGETVKAEPRSSIAGVFSTKSTKKVNTPSKPSHPPKPLTEEQKIRLDERRKATAEAAAARERAWEDRLAKQRVKREEAQAKDTAPKVAWNEKSNPLPDLPVDPEILRKQQNDAENLKKTGFDPYKAAISSSSNARAVIENLSSGQPSTSPAAAPLNDSSAELELKMRKARISLLNAMNGNDVQALADAIIEASKYDVPEVDEAKDLFKVLKEYTGQDEIKDGDELEIQDEAQDFSDIDFAIAAFVSAVDSKEKKSESCKTMQTLLSNLLEHPENPKFRKIRLENKTIREKIVEAAGGTCIEILISVGFSQITDEDGQNCLLVPDPSTLPKNVVVQARNSCEFALKTLKKIEL